MDWHNKIYRVVGYHGNNTHDYLANLKPFYTMCRPIDLVTHTSTAFKVITYATKEYSKSMPVEPCNTPQDTQHGPARYIVATTVGGLHLGVPTWLQSDG